MRLDFRITLRMAFAMRGRPRAVEGGATSHQLQSMFGWLSIKEAEVYTKAAERKKLAGDAMPLLGEVKAGTKLSHRRRG